MGRELVQALEVIERHRQRLHSGGRGAITSRPGRPTDDRAATARSNSRGFNAVYYMPTTCVLLDRLDTDSWRS